ncbi:methionyl-tRNA formyltransferase [Sungkyunkwania multivorans]|uniref:Methionyl-tRNA formyltransferase n=1 Tax=Sungkyunkwania multivorans TaxID=1173618 RepID=A0ABW3CZZ3_9FLAO
MRELRIVFMGTPHFAVATLETLIEANYNIVGVITAPDKPAGRGKKLRQSAVKEFALAHGLKVLQPTNLKDKSFIEELRALRPNLQVVVAFRMLPEVVWKLPKYGTFNLHASLLPDYRGAAPINWALINGDTKTGVTTFFIDEKIDTGEMIFQKEVDIFHEDDAGALHDRLMMEGSELVLKTVKAIEEGNVTTTPQPRDVETRDAFKIHKDTCKINWNERAENIYNKVRGLSPYPTAWSILHNEDREMNVKIYKVRPIVEAHKKEVGSVIVSKDQIKVAVIDGFIELMELQLPGKKRMDSASLLNGYHFSENAYMR